MNELFLGTKRFSMKDQVDFANFCGDFNSIHLEPIKARKTIPGECIVHGINSFLCALEFLLINKKNLYSNYLINFKNKIPLNQKIIFVIEKNHSLAIRNKHNKNLVLIQCDGILKSFPSKDQFNLSNYDSLDSPLDFYEKNYSIGAPVKIKYGGQSKYAEILFPSLCQYFGKNLVYELSLISNIIGMQIPGKNSLFASCEIKIKDNNVNPPYFKLESFKKKLKLLKVKYEGINFEAKMQAFLMKNSKSSVINKKLKDSLLSKNNNFYGRKALIIGGSRGIGSFLAKVLALLGSKVTISYFACYEDALDVCKDINQNNARERADFLKFDVLKDKFSDINKGNYDDLFYFATPKIFEKDSDAFSEEIYIQFKKVYADAFRKIALEFLERGGKKIYYPSSVAVEQDIKGMEEYKMAKKEGELVCNDLNVRFPLKILIDRLDRVNTDQTLSIIPTKSLDPYIVAIRIANMMK